MKGRNLDVPVPYRLSDGHPYALGSLDALDIAAAKLGVRPEELRTECERQAEQCGDVAIRLMEAGVVAFKTEGVWRFRFPVNQVATSTEPRSRKAR